MIVGTGMLASAFMRLSNQHSNMIIFASGVSNSRCKDIAQFQRETLLLQAALQNKPPDKPLFYFSTCSIYDPELQTSPYVIHKQKMEQLVLSQPNGHIIRLSQLVGTNTPSPTLIECLITKICSGQTIEVWTNAYRNILDVYDAVRIVMSLSLSLPKYSTITNIANSHSIPMPTLIDHIETLLNIKANKTILPKGSYYSINSSKCLAEARRIGINSGPHYTFEILKKSYS